jgi:hypothetical protein
LKIKETVMKFGAMLRVITCAAVLAAASIYSAAASQVLYDESGLLRGQQSFQDEFSVSGPGILTVTLSNVAWPASLASLDMVLGTSQGLLGPEMGPGTESFTVSGGNVFAQWFGSAQGALDCGVYGLKIEFTPTSTVPLPTSIALLLSGLVLLGWQRRQRRDAMRPRALPAG